MHTISELDTYIDVPYQDNREAKNAGAKWDEVEKQWFIPDDVAPEDFRKFHKWFEHVWRYAPECPQEKDPVKWGESLFSQLHDWASEYKLSPGSLQYWDINMGTPPIEECSSDDAVVQIVWSGGPSLWALRLSQRDDYRDWNSSKYVIEPIDEWSLAVSSI